VTWNLGGANLLKVAGCLLDLEGSSDPDVVFLQEVCTDSSAEALYELKGGMLFVGAKAPRCKQNAIWMKRWLIPLVRNLWSGGRFCAATLDVNGQTWTLTSLHLPPWNANKSEEAFTNAIEEFEKMVVDNPGRYLVGADANAELGKRLPTDPPGVGMHSRGIRSARGRTIISLFRRLGLAAPWSFTPVGFTYVGWRCNLEHNYDGVWCDLPTLRGLIHTETLPTSTLISDHRPSHSSWRLGWRRFVSRPSKVNSQPIITNVAAWARWSKTIEQTWDPNNPAVDDDLSEKLSLCAIEETLRDAVARCFEKVTPVTQLIADSSVINDLILTMRNSRDQTTKRRLGRAITRERKRIRAVMLQSQIVNVARGRQSFKNFPNDKIAETPFAIITSPPSTSSQSPSTSSLDFKYAFENHFETLLRGPLDDIALPGPSTDVVSWISNDRFDQGLALIRNGEPPCR